MARRCNLERGLIGNMAILENAKYWREKGFLERGFIRVGIYWRGVLIGGGIFKKEALWKGSVLKGAYRRVSIEDRDAYWRESLTGEGSVLELERGKY